MHLCTNLQISTRFIVSLYLATITLAISSPNESKQEDSTNIGHGQKFNVPFLVLMSPGEISVAQLPLIEKGNVSVAYSLIGSLAEEVEDDVGDEDESSSLQMRVTTNADAREREQMPRSTSLGKSEWQQQIADRNRLNASEGHSKEVGEGKEDASEAAPRGGKEINRPRRRSQRSIRAAGGSIRRSSHGNSLHSGHNNNSQNGTIAVMESSSRTNVTSAQFRRKREGEASSTSLPTEEDKIGTVQFCDFDVHMKLGYAFVADSTGRIHRFGLSGFEQSLEKENAKEDLHRATASYGANTIEASSSSFSNALGNLAPLSASNKKLSRLHNVVNEVSGSINSVEPNASKRNNDENNDTDANKVNQSGATHEQFGQHPTASGDKHLGVKSNLHSQKGSGSTRDSAPTSDSSYNREKFHQTRFNDAKPRIIWSRTKHVLSSGTHLSQSSPTVEDSSSNQEQPIATERALSERAESTGNTSDDGNNNNQMVNETWHMVSAEIGSGRPNDEVLLDSTQGRPTSGGTRESMPVSTESMRTEIAVDWLNNVLFVLDKYRLVMMDFDGKNELILIDDFTAKNRPINIKVDPVNNFLFWLQIGQFHNTIYKLDLNGLMIPTVTEKLISNSLRLNQSDRLSVGQTGGPSSELIALMTVHYAHPVITHLPKHTRLFMVDHKHSRIYVPLAPATSDSGVERNKTLRDDTEVFATSSDESNSVTHMNQTMTANQLDETQLYDQGDLNCTNFASNGQILAYNLDGTDVGPLRSGEERSHLASLSNIQDISFDTERGFLYWLSKDGKDLFEEYKTGRDSTFYSAQHNLDGKQYTKLLHFDNGSNQPTDRKPRFSIRNLILMLSPSKSPRPPRYADDQLEPSGTFSGLDRNHPENDLDRSRFSRNVPFIILGITGLIVVSIYLIYTFIFQQVDGQRVEKSDSLSREGSIGSSSLGDSNVDSELHTNGFTATSSISRWITKPSSREAYISSFNNGSSENEHNHSFDLESSNYGNAVDEHYRVEARNEELDLNRLANLSGWPTNLYDMSNKLYVPVEVTQDEALASINRISIDQLDIERRAPLGEGHFGTVLQGVIKCTENQKAAMLHKPQANCTITLPTMAQSFITQRRVPVSSSTSSGHGSSSTSSDFVTANNDTSNGDYLTPKSQCNSTMSDYNIEEPTTSVPSSCVGYSNQGELKQTNIVGTKLRVAIKKLKDNASAEEKRDFLQEAKLLANFDHPNIVHLMGICLDRGSTLIVMELMLGGDLIRYMEENTPKPNRPENLTHDDLLKICLDIVNGCCYLEELNYIHRDLAARNCLVSSRKKEDRVVKLADFGLARDIYKDSYYKKLNDSAMPLKWMAPECLTDQKFTIMSDVWSFGVVMWEVMSYCQEKPYGDVVPCFMREHLISGARLKKPITCSDDVYRLMNHCWQLDPNSRPSFNECRATLIEIRNGHEQQNESSSLLL